MTSRILTLIGPILIALAYLSALGILLFLSLISGIQTLILAAILHVLYAIWEENG